MQQYVQHATCNICTAYNIYALSIHRTPCSRAAGCATVRNATHVVVLKHGEVVEAGTSLVPIVARAPCD